MKETLICKLEKHSIYYLNNSEVGFYILMPNKEFNETNITIRLKSNYETYDLNKNDLTKVQNELVNYYKELDNYNITLILPIFNDDILDLVKTANDMELYHKLDVYFGDIFNNAFSFLNKNNIKVKNKIYMINNDTFSNFTNWYVNKYNTRIEYKTVMDLVKEGGNYQSYDVVETPGTNIVIGKEKEPSIEKTIEMEVETFDNMVKNISREERPANAGFISYFLLGIITFIVSLSLLYILIK